MKYVAFVGFSHIECADISFRNHSPSSQASYTLVQFNLIKKKKSFTCPNMAWGSKAYSANTTPQTQHTELTHIQYC